MQNSLLAAGLVFGPGLKVDGLAEGVVDPVPVTVDLADHLLTPETINTPHLQPSPPVGRKNPTQCLVKCSLHPSH